MLHIRADRGGRLFAAKFFVVVHYLPHQLLNHVLSNDPILVLHRRMNPRLSKHEGRVELDPALHSEIVSASRSSRPMLASDRSTVTPLSPPPHQGANRRTRHQPPANSNSCSTG